MIPTSEVLIDGAPKGLSYAHTDRAEKRADSAPVSLDAINLKYYKNKYSCPKRGLDMDSRVTMRPVPTLRCR